MAYGKFTTYEEVAIKFKIKLIELSFLQERDIAIKEDIFNLIKDNLQLRRNYIMEIIPYSALEDIQKLLNTLNWMFYEAHNNVQKICNKV